MISYLLHFAIHIIDFVFLINFLNMGILFCMYYAAHFHAKYDKKSAKTYIYVSLFIAMVFFLMQFKTLANFML